jgi:hypothetical protein
MRAQANEGSAALGHMAFGTRVHVVEGARQHPGWCRIVLPGDGGFANAPRVHFPPAAAMDVGSGTVPGEVARVTKKIEQRIADIRTAWRGRRWLPPDAVKQRAGEAATGPIDGLIDFAKDAAKILAARTAIGAKDHHHREEPYVHPRFV